MNWTIHKQVNIFMVFGSYWVTKKLLISIDTLHISIIRAEFDISLHRVLAKRKKYGNSNGIGQFIHAGLWPTYLGLLGITTLVMVGRGLKPLINI